MSKKFDILSLIMTNLICAGPCVWCALKIVTKEYDSLLGYLLASYLCIIFACLCWVNFFRNRREDIENEDTY